MSPSEHVRLTVEDPVALIQLDRPERLNAFTHVMLAALRRAVDAAVADPAVVGIVITGEGRAFSAGLDAAVLGEVTRADAPPAATAVGGEALPGLFSYLTRVPKPVIAAVNGVAAGGGLILALMSDLRIASQAASFTTVFLQRGLIAEHGSSWLLPRLVGLGRALDLLWTGDRIDAATAREIGLVERVVPPADLVGAARAYVRRLAEVAPPAAMAETKRLVYEHAGMDLVTALREAEAVQNRFVTSPDAVEGAKSFLEKRPPRFERLGAGDGAPEAEP